MPQDVTQEALQGYDWNPQHTEKNGNPYLATSTSWEAWQIGRWLEATGRDKPGTVRTSRGSTYNVGSNQMKVKVARNGDVTRIY